MTHNKLPPLPEPIGETYLWDGCEAGSPRYQPRTEVRWKNGTPAPGNKLFTADQTRAYAVAYAEALRQSQSLPAGAVDSIIASLDKLADYAGILHHDQPVVTLATVRHVLQSALQADAREKGEAQQFERDEEMAAQGWTENRDATQPAQASPADQLAAQAQELNMGYETQAVQASEAVATVCLVGEKFGHQKFVEVNLQVATDYVPRIGDKLYTHPQPVTPAAQECDHDCRSALTSCLRLLDIPSVANAAAGYGLVQARHDARQALATQPAQASEKDNGELKPCPFCGGPAHITRSGTLSVCGCYDCGFDRRDGRRAPGWFARDDDAIAAWNRRAAHPQPARASEKDNG